MGLPALAQISNTTSTFSGAISAVCSFNGLASPLNEQTAEIAPLKVEVVFDICANAGNPISSEPAAPKAAAAVLAHSAQTSLQPINCDQFSQLPCFCLIPRSPDYADRALAGSLQIAF